MDGGVKQKEMAGQIKREVKEKSRLAIDVLTISNDSQLLTQERPKELDASISILLETTAHSHHAKADSPSNASLPWLKSASDATHHSRDGDESFAQTDATLLMFYLDHVLPFLYPFYRPVLLQGGRAWVLDLMKRPAIQQATLCQSVYFYSLALGAEDGLWDRVLIQTQYAFGVLREALQVIDGLRITEHVHCAARILASIVQMQRFEVAISSFENWRTHLNAALTIFTQLLDSPVGVSIQGTYTTEGGSRYRILVDRLGYCSPSQVNSIPSAEQAAFSFSSAIVIFDDIIASTVLQEQPQLYDHHRSLLCPNECGDPPVDIDGVIGIKNWVLLEIGEVSALDAWKQQCLKGGNLNVLELARRGMVIKESLVDQLMRLETASEPLALEKNNSSDILTAFDHQPKLSSQTAFITQVWAHAALIYLLVVLSGWQPASPDVRYNVDRVIELLTHSPHPALLRTMVWPFCVAGCLAEPTQESQLRILVKPLPRSIYGTVHKALDIMETVWQNRDGPTNRDLAICFRNQGDLVLLV